MKVLIKRKSKLIERLILNEADIEDIETGVTRTGNNDNTDIEAGQTRDNNTTAAENTQKDWGEEYEKAKRSGSSTALNAFWTEYINKEWHGYENKVKKLGEAFYVEMSEIGFSPAINPFIPFLKDILNRFSPDSNHYGTVHNLYANNKITDADINNENGLLRCQNLYEIPVSEIDDYVECYHKILKNIKNTDADDRKKGIEAVKSATKASGEVVLKDGDALVDQIMYKDANKSIYERTIRSLATIKLCLKLIFNEDVNANKQTTIDDAELNKLIGTNNTEENTKILLAIVAGELYKYDNTAIKTYYQKAKIDNKLSYEKVEQFKIDNLSKKRLKLPENQKALTTMADTLVSKIQGTTNP